MPELETVLSRIEIERKVKAVAGQISTDYIGRKPVLIGVLKGAFIFLADLVRYMTIPVRVDFIRTASYGTELTSSGRIRLLTDIDIDIKGEDALIIEDIVDTGATLDFLVEHISRFKPRSLKTCVLLNKQARREKRTLIDYVAHEVEDGFLVGYGLDCAEDYRYLSGICRLKS
jgi:hypoxanthine phosphoribosyltransferase